LDDASLHGEYANSISISHDTGHANTGAISEQGITYAPGTYPVDQHISGHNYASLLGTGLLDTDAANTITGLKSTGWDFDSIDEHADFTCPMQNLEPVSFDSVPIPSISTKDHYYRQRNSGDISSRTPRLRGPTSKKPSAFVKDWYLTHASPPYPSRDQVGALATLSGLSKQQIKTCLNNLRARTKDGKSDQMIT
jgi:hypothetical protein